MRLIDNAVDDAGDLGVTNTPVVAPVAIGAFLTCHMKP